MRPSFGIVYPLASRRDAFPALLDRVAGEVGIDHLTVPVVTRPTAAASVVDRVPRDVSQEGGWQYAPTVSHYASALRPRVADWVGRSNLLRRVCEYAAGQRLAVYLRLDLLRVPALCGHHAHACCHDAWNQPVSGGLLCPAQPDVRALLRETLDELAAYEPAGIEIEDFAPSELHVPAAGRPLAWNPLVRRLMDVCFCPACRETAGAAGLDPDQAARSVRAHVERLIGGPPATHDARVSADPVLRAYLSARRDDLRKWLSRLGGGAPVAKFLLLRAADPAADALLPQSWRRLQAIDASHTAELADARAAAPRGDALAIHAWRPTVADAAALVRLVDEAAGRGVSFFDFEGIEEYPDESITWLRQAVRYARREAGA